MTPIKKTKSRAKPRRKRAIKKAAAPAKKANPGTKTKSARETLAETVATLADHKSSAERLSEETVIAALHLTHGNMSNAAKLLNVRRQSLYEWKKSYPEIDKAIDQSREAATDNIESALYTKALSGNVAAQIFWLKCKGKDRGWVERSEITTPKEGAIRLFVEYGEQFTAQDDIGQAAAPASEADTVSKQQGQT
jgi:hypothetical protein